MEHVEEQENLALKGAIVEVTLSCGSERYVGRAEVVRKESSGTPWHRTPLNRHYTLVTEFLEHRSSEWVLENPLIGAFHELKTVALPRRIRCLNAGGPDLADIAVLSRR